ncbi:ABC transporter ATP-binding protein/permease [Candidatus Pelagibacter bacterium]|jgi:ABC-type multidrug transport system fused ATPase/permease subunit|nr:ABC transporter ATP-binding protein/permease [Candidatus Pelagibacter bacterium]
MSTHRKLLYLLSKKERKQGIILVFMFLTMAVLDIIGVASILPFIYVLSNPEIIQSNSLMRSAYEFSGHLGIENSQDFLFGLGILFFILLVVSLSFKALTTYVQTHFSQMRQYSIAKRLMEGYLHQPYSWFLNRNSADLGKSILSEVGIVVSGGIKPFLNLIAQSIIALALLSLIIFTNPKLAIVVGITLSLSFGIIYKCSRNFLKKIGEERVVRNKLRFTALSEAFGAVKEIKLGGLEKTYIEKFSEAAKIIAKVNAQGKVITVLPRYAVEAVAFGGMIIVVLFLMLQKATFADVLPIVALYAFAGYRLMPALQSIYADITELRFIGPALDMMFNDLKSLQAYSYNNDRSFLTLNDHIILNNINYSYPKSSKTALKNIELKIPAKSTVGFVGATGSGKTTTIDIILGLLEAQQGNLQVDNKVIDNQNRKAWQRSIGYVPQEIYLADDTIAANIAFGKKNSKDIKYADVERAAKIANLHDFIIQELPNKYETKVGERGIRLSGGQRQRIGIARALYNKPQVLILDEATSALDNLTEQAVMDAVHNLGKDITIIIIAHRLSTVKECDIIFLLEKGELRAQGTFEKLIEINDNFRENARGV